MKIGLVTPLANRSAIGQHGRNVGEELAKRGWTVDILRSEISKDDYEPALDTFLKVLWLADLSIQNLNQKYDLLIYNIGDNYLFHGAALDRLVQCPGLLIAHDFFLYNLFAGWLTRDANPDLTHELVISNLYNTKPASLNEIQAGKVSSEVIASSHPMIEWVSQFSIGALAHSQFYAHRLRSSCLGPVGVAPLAYRATITAPPKTRQRDTFRIATLGAANANKRISSIIQAIGSTHELRALCEYTVVGEARPNDRERWNQEARAQGLKHFEITGHVPDQEFAAYIADADVLTCLRDPVLEGGSGSVVEGLLSGRPVIVSDHGCYAEIPNHCVYRVRPRHELSDLTTALLSIVRDEATASRVSAAGKSYALIEHSIERYADHLMHLAEETILWAPVVATGLGFGDELSSMGIQKDDPVLARLALALSNIDWKSVRQFPASDNQ